MTLSGPAATVFRLPTELLLEVTRYLKKEDRWSLAIAYPFARELMIPVLNNLGLSNYAPFPCDDADTTIVLVFLHKFLFFADQIRHFSYYIDTECDKTHNGLTDKTDSSVRGWVHTPWLHDWTQEQEFEILGSLVERSGLQSFTRPSMLPSVPQHTADEQTESSTVLHINTVVTLSSRVVDFCTLATESDMEISTLLPQKPISSSSRRSPMISLVS
jgi:hypothetical protein